MPTKTAPRTDLDSVRLCDACLVETDRRWYVGALDQEAPCSRCDSWEAWHVLLPRANDPRLEGDPSWPEFTTSVTVEPYRPVVWDVNRYYRDLGVHHWATKAQLREAYIARGGPESPRLTYVLKQLLNDEIRARYDATPVGSVFFDAEVEAEVRRRIAEEVRQSRLAPADDAQPLVEVDLTHLINREFSLDKRSCSGEDGRTLPEGRWGWYRWGTAVSGRYRLDEWRGLLAKAFSDRGITRRLAVGWYNQPEPWMVKSVGRRTVIFLNPLNIPNPLTADQIANIFQ